MAIIIGEPQCCICKQEIEKDEAWTATWGVPFAPPHHLYPFCDAPLHFSCLSNWPYREEYSFGYFQIFREMHEAGIGHILAEGELWFLGCGPCPTGQRPYYVQVVLAHWPIRLKLDKWQEWNQFVTEGFKQGLAGQCLVDVEAVMREVRILAGNQEALDSLHDAAQV